LQFDEGWWSLEAEQRASQFAYRLVFFRKLSDFLRTEWAVHNGWRAAHTHECVA